ncbi:DJ-1/PfpI family protein [Nocardioides sp. GCM10027113]|uniref:DJ-1/PfpI family protein n=1 Tax=unclassified Nocardioides TaxID=2615069 RepID=UPI0036107472
MSSSRPTVHIALYDTFADWELGHLTTALNGDDFHQGPGYDVRYVGATLDPVTSMGGMRALPDVLLHDLSPADSAMLVLPGSQIWATEAYRPFVDKARDFLTAGTPVAAICGATGALAQAGLLDDRAHTSNAPEFLAALGYAGAAHYVDEPAVVDGDLVTASGVAPVEFARAALARLDAWSPEVLDSWFRLYRHQDPAGFHELMAASS